MKRLLWGVEWQSANGERHLLTMIWHANARSLYPGEPIRMLLFQNRREARKWCKWYGNGVHPVHVRESVVKV